MRSRRDSYVDRGTSYSLRGERERRRTRRRQWLLGATMVGCFALLVAERHPREAQADEAPAPRSTMGFYGGGEVRRLRAALEQTRGELDIANARVARLERASGYSARYRIPADLALSIHDIALAEGIDPELGFRLVQLESGFNERATSPVGAIGLMQVMPGTARYFQKGISVEQLYDRETNLRIGFRYLRTLIDQRDGDLRLALLVYNRGPVIVDRLRAQGIDPGNGYARILLRGYEGRGVAE